MEYSVIIPVYNEQESIRPLYCRLREAMDGLGKSYEIIFINDGSTDGTFGILESLYCEKNYLSVVNFVKNQGQSAAYQEGFNRAKGEIIITMDGDLQNDPKDIPKLLYKLEEGYDAVCGWRKNRRDPFMIKFLSKIANLCRRLTLGEKLHDANCSLRVYKRESLKSIDLTGNMYYMITAILAASGCRIGEVEINHYPRKFDKSKFNIQKRILLFNGLLVFKYLYNRNKYLKNDELFR